MTIDASAPNFKVPPGAVRRVPHHRPLELRPQQAADISIITPYFNTGEIFEETLRSVLDQTYQNWEWIIVDDGSTDETCLRRLAELRFEEQRIRVMRQENAGPGAARNKAVDNSVGRYICILDSDDLLEPTYLEVCAWFLDSNRNFSFCNSYSVVFGEREHLWTTGFERGRAFLDANSGPPISLIRREDFLATGGFDASIRQGHEDWDFWLTMASKGHWGYTIPEYLQWYRTRADGRFAQISGDAALHKKFEKRMREKYSALERHFPNPRREPSLPFETIETTWRARNPLAKDAKAFRVLFVLPWMSIGGADRVNLDLIEGLIGRGHQVSVCTTLDSPNAWGHKFSELTADIFALPNFLRPVDFPRFLSYLMDSRQTDVVVLSASTLGYQLLPLLQAANPRIAFVDLCHVEEPHWQNGGHPRFAAGYQDALDLNVVTTRRLAQWVASRGADPDRVRLMYTGVRAALRTSQVANREELRRRLGISPATPIIIWAGRICEQKRPAMLAEILKEARDAGLEFAAVLIGEGELRPQLEAMLYRYDLRSRVHLLGSVAHEVWLDALQASDILLMPSRYEGISVAFLEAMAAGVVPVVANVGGQAEVIGPAEGYLIPHGDEETKEYVAALGAMLRAPMLQREKSAACRSLMETRYAWSGTIDQFEGILAEAVARRHLRPARFTMAMGREFATLAIEYKRVCDEFQGHWNRGQLGAGGANGANTLLESQLVRAALLVGRIRVVRTLLASRSFQRIAHYIYRRLRNRTAQ
jgi:glycosyltransferase involved in cell wall biosynthesis